MSASSRMSGWHASSVFGTTVRSSRSACSSCWAANEEGWVLNSGFHDGSSRVLVMRSLADADGQRAEIARREALALDQVDALVAVMGGGFVDDHRGVGGARRFTFQRGAAVAIDIGAAQAIQFQQTLADAPASTVDEGDMNLEVFEQISHRADVEGKDGGAGALAGPGGLAVPHFDAIFLLGM